MRRNLSATIGQSVKLLMSMYDAKPRSVNLSLPGYEDRVAVSILQKYHGVMLDRMSTRATIGDGYCGYR